MRMISNSLANEVIRAIDVVKRNFRPTKIRQLNAIEKLLQLRQALIKQTNDYDKS